MARTTKANSVSIGKATAARPVPTPSSTRSVPESPSSLDQALSDTWRRDGPWSVVDARHTAQAIDVATGERVLLSAVFCAGDGMATARLAREIGALELLAHQPAAVPLLDSGRAAGWLYCVTPWLDGRSLADLISRDGPLPVHDAVSMAIALADLLHFSHGIGVLHGMLTSQHIWISDGDVRLGGFQRAMRHTVRARDTQHTALDVFDLARALFAALSGQTWQRGAPMPDALPDELTFVLHRALGANRDARFLTAIAFAQALCAVRENALVAEGEVRGRDVYEQTALDELPLSDTADRSLRVLHALLDRAEVADQAPEHDDPLVQRCWARAAQQVAPGDARLVALHCRWRLLADRDPVAALAASQPARYAAEVVPYRARALAALGQAAEARTLAVRSWFDDVALDLSAVRSLMMALLLTRSFDLASLVSVAERAQGVVDPVIMAAGQVSASLGAVRPLTAAAQSRTLRAISAAIDERVPWTAELLVDPRWDGLRSDHRFSALLARSKAAWTS